MPVEDEIKKRPTIHLYVYSIFCLKIFHFVEDDEL